MCSYNIFFLLLLIEYTGKVMPEKLEQPVDVVLLFNKMNVKILVSENKNLFSLLIADDN